MQDTPSVSPPAGVRRRVGAVLARVRARPITVSVIAALLVALFARSYIYGSVFRDGTVVLLANDPYFYRFAVERHVAAAGDVGALLRYDQRDPFLVVTLSLAVALFGGVDHAPSVLAWYPVVAGVATVALVYAFATLVSGSRTVGVVAAVALAVSPVHVVRTALGFSDHHAADFFWLVASATLLAVLWTATSRSRRLLAATGLAVTLAIQVLSWEGGLVLVLPAAVVVVVGSVFDAVDARSQRAGLAAAASFVVAALLVAGAFVRFSWHDRTTVFAFGLLAAAVALVVVVLALVGAVTASGRAALGVSGAVGVAGVAVGVVAGVGEWFAPVLSLVRAGLAFAETSRTSGIAETVSLVGGPLGPLTGPFSLFGLQLFVALPPLVVASLRAVRRRHVGSVVLSTYSWYLLALALVQRRFAGELSPFVAVLVGVAVVDLARRTGVLSSPSPSTVRPLLPATLARLRRYGPVALSLLLVLLVVSSSAVLAVKLNQSVVPDAEYDAVDALRTYAVDHDLAYPESYVLSPLGNNRLFNYEVNAASTPELSYRYAEAHYAPFVYSESPESQYWQHADRVGFLVTTDAVATASATPDSVYVRLHDRLGSDGDGVAGTGHYRLVYASPDGSVKAFALVPGAVVVGTADPGERVTLSLPVTVGDRSFTYTRTTTATAVGRYAITVPYPGTYAVDGRDVRVTERDVLDGRFVATDGSPTVTRAHWSFDAGAGDVAFDLVGGNHGRVRGPVWTDSGMAFRGTGGVVVPGDFTPTAETGLALTVRFEGLGDIDRTSPEQTRFQRLVATAPAGRYTTTDGYQIGVVDGQIVGAIGDGPGAADVRGPAVDDGAPHTVSLLWDGAVVRLVLDGQVVDETPYDGPVTPATALVVGATTDDRYPFRGVVTDVRLDLVRATEPPETHAAHAANASRRTA